MAAREFRFIQCVIEALCDSIGIGRPNAPATSLSPRRGCGGPAFGRIAGGRGAASDDQKVITGSCPGGWYELPTFVRRGIVIPGIETLDNKRPSVPEGRLDGSSGSGADNSGH